ncbi:serine hydrolase domain-containing protein [Actinocrinis sp.]|uniref:serine hydrolase domain-containing protein n=1 Tax=Actinocrinis sp. TaxID=1920516 RepID=UPI002BDE7C15|nr:serine hydrolase domain-containing protein [Actinocrinis sp.]HXR69883.1 serine hydrolase domain-containing protein [Actinocrinis sp.]
MDAKYMKYMRAFARAGHTRVGVVVGVAGAVALVCGALAPVAQAAAPAGASGPGAAAPALVAGVGTPTPQLPPLDPAALRAAISGLPNADITGSLLQVNDLQTGDGWRGVSGIGDVATGRVPSAADRFRIGSVTKVFTATVTLQLVAAHQVSLTETIQHYLPGELPASYPPITVAELLNHTSGLPGVDVGDDEGDPAGFVAHRFEHPTPQQIVGALAGEPMAFAPGTAQRYNGVNYFLLGMLIERVTGHSYGEEVNARIIRPLGLHDTSAPAATSFRIPGPHLHGYLAVPAADGSGATTLVDVSEQSPYPWAEGGMISSARDLRTLMVALFTGRLLPSAELNDMFTVPDVPYVAADQCQVGNPGHACFGMGLMSATLGGVTVWGKTGSRPGYTDGVFATQDLQRVLVYAFSPTSESVNSSPFILAIAHAALR